MRRLDHAPPLLLIGLASVALGCGEAAPANETEETGEVPVVEMATAAEGLLSPNLASAEELTRAGLTAEAAESLIAHRPYLRASQLHAELAGTMGEAGALAAYDAVWLRINLNDVTEEEILRIPGVGDRMAHEFEEYRPYEDMAEFRREMAKYVDAAEVDRLAQYVFVPIDLNTASRETILMIPGMDDRMAHEFEEYRPYTDLDQFRREMGKYVDANEVARLERYVSIR